MDKFYGLLCLVSPRKDATHYHGANAACAGTDPRVSTVLRAERRGLRPHVCYQPHPIDIHSTEGIRRQR